MPHRILLADDSLTIQKVIELTFSGTDFELKAVGNGDLALPLLDSFSPDIVLADCVMPGKTGYELCEEVKRRPGGRFVPVVLLTGTFEPFDKPRAEQAGADSVVTKPFDSQGLAVARARPREQGRRRAGRRAPRAPSGAGAASRLPEPPPSRSSCRLLPSRSARESTDPTLAGRAPFSTVPMSAMQTPPPLSEQDLYATSAIPVFRDSEIELPPDSEAASPPPPDQPTEPISAVPEPATAAYEMDLGALDDEPPQRDLEADIAAFEASGRGDHPAGPLGHARRESRGRGLARRARSGRARGPRRRSEPDRSQEPHPEGDGVGRRPARGRAPHRRRHRPHRAAGPRALRRAHRAQDRVGRRARARRAPRERAPRRAGQGGIAGFPGSLPQTRALVRSCAFADEHAARARQDLRPRLVRDALVSRPGGSRVLPPRGGRA